MTIRNRHDGSLGAVLFQFTHVPVIRFKQPRWSYVDAILHTLIHFMIIRPIVLFARDPLTNPNE
jgi:hypothetical protein